MKIRIRKIMGLTAVVVLSAALFAGCGSKAKETEKETVQETQQPETPQLEASTGTVVSLKSNKLTMETSDGKELVFDIADADKKGEKDIKTGNPVAVVYTGDISGTDTEGAVVELVIAMESGSSTSSTGETTKSSSESGQMTGEVVTYIEGEKLVITNDADGEKYYFSTDDDTVISSGDIAEGDTVTVAYTGDITGNDLVPATKITAKSSGSSTTTGTGSTGSSTKNETISGTVTAASMNTVTIETSGGTTYTFSTMDADIGITGGIEEGMDITLHYSGDLSEGAEGVTVTSVEEDK